MSGRRALEPQRVRSESTGRGRPPRETWPPILGLGNSGLPLHGGCVGGGGVLVARAFRVREPLKPQPLNRILRAPFALLGLH